MFMINNKFDFKKLSKSLKILHLFEFYKIKRVYFIMNKKNSPKPSALNALNSFHFPIFSFLMLSFPHLNSQTLKS